MARNSALHLLGYSPPELHTGSTWFVSYYVVHPDTGEPVRKRVKLNRVKGTTARRAHARQVMAELQRRLAAGWRPWVASDAPNAHRTLRQGVDAYLRAKVQDLRHSSPTAYTSHARLFMAWAEREHLADRYAHAFTKHHAQAFLAYVQDERQVGARTWNNYRTFSATMWNWLHEHGYTGANVFRGIRARREPPKVRTYLSAQQRQQLVDWCEQHQPQFLVACLFVFHCLIRPRELGRLRVQDVDLQRQVVHLSATVTKNGEAGVASIPNAMLPYLQGLRLHLAPADHYLMGRGFVPGTSPAHRNTYVRAWDKVRSGLGWGPELQLYSLRDTGIISLLQQGVDVLAVKQQARHKDLATTNRYLRHAFPEGSEAVRRQAQPLRPGPVQE